jgi:hypothetical protein
MNIDRIKRTAFHNHHADARRDQYHRDGGELIDTEITHEAILSGSKRGVYPAGSVWCFMTNEVYGPKPNRTRNAG